MKLKSLQELKDKYGEMIKAACKKHNLEEHLLAGLIWQESRGDWQAVSSVGAFGLTQVMPATAKDRGYNLSTPEKQIYAGADYLAWIDKHFSKGDVVKLLAAYNAGVGRLKDNKWKRFKETRDYVSKVQLHAEKYKQLLTEEAICGEELSNGSTVEKRSYRVWLRGWLPCLCSKASSQRK
jgi:soluble lytic murein transglycosylase-like protein